MFLQSSDYELSGQLKLEKQDNILFLITKTIQNGKKTDYFTDRFKFF